MHERHYICSDLFFSFEHRPRGHRTELDHMIRSEPDLKMAIVNRGGFLPQNAEPRNCLYFRVFTTTF